MKRFRKTWDKYYCPRESTGWCHQGVWHVDKLYQIKLFGKWITFWRHPVAW